VAASVARGECEVGILISGSGIEMCMAANKVCGIRAAVVHDEFVARRTRERHQCNILCLGAGLDGLNSLEMIIDAFLSATARSERSAIIVERLAQIEQMRADPAHYERI
jgi:ribose 5-phosphate isomerase B